MLSSILQTQLPAPPVRLLSVALGSVFLSVGLMALVAATNKLAKKQIFIALAAFAFLYGARLWIGGVAQPSSARVYALAMISYFILIPASVLVMNILSSRWHRVSLWIIGVLSLFAVTGALSDMIRKTPFSLNRVNSAVVIIAVVVLLVLLVRDARSAGKRPRRSKIVFNSFLLLIGGIVYENMQGFGLLPGIPDIEAITLAIFLICVMYFALGEILERQSRLAVIDAELAQAQSIQTGLLPKAMPVIAGAEIAARYLPMRQVAGDFYEFVELSSDSVGVLVADVTGHGVAAALVASMLKAAMLILRDQAEDPAALLARLNTVFCNQLDAQFITAVYAVFDVRERSVRFSAAGHPPLLQWQRATCKTELLESNGLPLGMFANSQYPLAEAAFNPGDRILFYTDGLPEAADAREEQFGMERMQAVLSKEPSAASIVETIMLAVREWRGSHEMEDDLTALAIVNVSVQ